MRLRPKALGLCLGIVLASQAGAQSAEEEEEFALAYGDKSIISIATGAAQPVARAPAVATVITAEDIAAIGATDLDDVLETVPGLHVSRTGEFNNPKYFIRGISSQYNPQVLMLINGIPMTSVFVGDRGDLWGGMPVENIARIEVIRGPGSALYGAEAFSGVINIITKTAGDIGGTRFGVRTGSFGSRDGWVLHGGKLGAIEVAAYFRAGTTDGFKKTIAADAQTATDAAFGTSASLAPGSGNFGQDAIDGQLDLSYDKWRFRTAYKKRDNVGSGYGVASALDPSGQSSSERYTADLTYQDRNFAPDWDVTFQGSYSDYNEQSRLVLLPAGTSFFPLGGTFPDGMIGNPAKWERHARFAASAFYTGFANHRLRLGMGYTSEDLYRTREAKNFTFTGTVFPQSLGSVVDASDTAIFLTPHKRNVKFLYAQDEWSFAKDWTLTAGVRHDRYSDFGGTTNPRLALVWEASYDLTAKLLYGKAFRAPSFIELYAANNPVVTGNSNLKPETIETLETSLAWQPRTDLQLGLNLFRYHMRDILRFVANENPITGKTAQNSGDQKGYGLETEAAWDISKTLRLSGNYAWQRSTDVSSDSDAGDAPHHHVYMRADWHFASEWALHGQVNWIAGRKRAAGDNRPDAPDYTTTDLTLRWGNNRNPWGVTLSVRNLTNERVLEPSLAPGQIPGDLPQAGRSWFAQVQYKL